MKAHTYYTIFGRPPIGWKLPPSPLAAPLRPLSASRGRIINDSVTVAVKSVGSECAVYFVDGVRIISVGSSGGSAISEEREADFSITQT